MTARLTTKPKRDASSPVQGGLRAGVDVAVATVLVSVLGPYIPQDLVPYLNEIVLVATTGVLASVGKVLRDRKSIIGKIF